MRLHPGCGSEGNRLCNSVSVREGMSPESNDEAGCFITPNKYEKTNVTTTFIYRPQFSGK